MTFQEFWPYYVREHSKAGTRVMHFAGTTLLLLCLAAAITFQSAWFVLYGVLCGYGFAWIGHFGIEKNRPATFHYPLLSLIADFKMYGLMWAGKMGSTAEALTSERK